MNPTKDKAFDAALTIASIYGVDHESAEDLLDMARRFECYLDGSESHVESGADAEAVADKVFADGANGKEDWAAYHRYAPHVATSDGLLKGPGAGEDANGAADGRSAGETQVTSQGAKSAKVKKPRKVKAAKKAKRAKKAKSASDETPSTAEALKDEVPHSEAKAEEPAMDAAA